MQLSANITFCSILLNQSSGFFFFFYCPTSLVRNVTWVVLSSFPSQKWEKTWKPSLPPPWGQPSPHWPSILINSAIRLPRPTCGLQGPRFAASEAEVGNVRPPGRVRPKESLGLALPRHWGELMKCLIKQTNFHVDEFCIALKGCSKSPKGPLRQKEGSPSLTRGLRKAQGSWLELAP